MAYRSIFQDAIDLIGQILDNDTSLAGRPSTVYDMPVTPDFRLQAFQPSMALPMPGSRSTIASAGVAPSRNGIDTVTVHRNASQVGRISDANPRTAAARELAGTYHEMKQKNVPGTDHFFHCLAACRAVQKTNDKSAVLNTMKHKEYGDRALNLFGLYGKKPLSPSEMNADMAADMATNTWGATCPPGTDCNDRCSPYLDNLPVKNRVFMRKYRTQW